MDAQRRKNILDLTYQKHLQIATASVIVFFTIVVGLTVAFVTNQLQWSNSTHLFSVLAILALFGVSCLFIVSRSSRHMKKIIEAIEQLS